MASPADLSHAFEPRRPRGAVIRDNRDGGVLIARDALQHWLAPDEFFGHGELLRERARDAFTATFRRVFGV